MRKENMNQIAEDIRMFADRADAFELQGEAYAREVLAAFKNTRGMSFLLEFCSDEIGENKKAGEVPEKDYFTAAELAAKDGYTELEFNELLIKAGMQVAVHNDEGDVFFVPTELGKRYSVVETIEE